MKVRITSVLTRYTDGIKQLEVEARTVAEAVDELDKRYPGIKFRFIDEQGQIRDHMNLFLNKEQIRTLEISTTQDDELFIVHSISGGWLLVSFIHWSGQEPVQRIVIG